MPRNFSTTTLSSLSVLAALMAGCQAPASTPVPGAAPDTGARALMAVAQAAPLAIARADASIYSEAMVRTYDGDEESAWGSGSQRNSWTRFYLKESARISELKAKVRPGVPYHVEVSRDGKTWERVLTSQKNSTWSMETKRFPAEKEGLALRLLFQGKKEPWLFEVALMGAALTTSSPSPSASATPAPLPSASTAPTPAPSATLAPTPTPTPAPSQTPAPTGPGLYVSPQGNDSNAGTASAPLRTLKAAASRVQAGQTVYVAAGTYQEQLITQRAGSASAPITFQGYNGVPVIDGSAFNWTLGGDQNQGLVILNHDYNVLKGFKVVNSKNTGVVLNADNLLVTGCEVAYTQRHAISTDTDRQTNWPGLKGTNIKNAVIDNVDVHHAVLKGPGYGQAVSLIADGFEVKNSRFHDNALESVDIWMGAKNGEVKNNRFYNNTRVSIYVDGADSVRIHGNEVWNSPKGVGISSEDPNYETRRIWIYNNVIRDNTETACFIWDPNQGPTQTYFFNNTLVNNRSNFYFEGQGLSGEVMNNLAVGGGMPGSSGQIAVHDNLQLSSATGFVDAGAKNYALAAGSSAIDKAKALPSMTDLLGRRLTVETDYAGQRRVAGAAPDFGAYERQ